MTLIINPHRVKLSDFLFLYIPYKERIRVCDRSTKKVYFEGPACKCDKIKKEILDREVAAITPGISTFSVDDECVPCLVTEINIE